jgi:hypothetical protein
MTGQPNEDGTFRFEGVNHAGPEPVPVTLYRVKFDQPLTPEEADAIFGPEWRSWQEAPAEWLDAPGIVIK